MWFSLLTRHSINSMRTLLVPALSSLLLTSCGGGSGGGTNAGAGNPNTPDTTPIVAPGGNTVPAGITGSLVYSYVHQFPSGLKRAVRVFDLATRKETIFPGVEFQEKGVSVSTNGTIAQMEQGNDTVFVRLTTLKGSLIRDFEIQQELSFATSGVRISPDASKIAFSLNQIVDPRTSDRGEVIYVCNVAGVISCQRFAGLTDPGWTFDGLVVATNEDQTRLYLSDASYQKYAAVGPTNLSSIRTPRGTPDNQAILFGARGPGAGVGVQAHALNRATQLVTQLTAEGLDKFDPVVSPDGKWLVFGQKVCSINSAGVFLVLLNAIPLNLGRTQVAETIDNCIKDGSGNSIAYDGDLAATPAVIN
jgi:WD40-like Beta Propeller Repeat